MSTSESRVPARQTGRAGWSDIAGMALFALRGNWMRSILTALGVIIGIAAVIVMVSVGQGTQAQLDATIARLGSNRVDVMPNFGRQGGVRMGAGSIFSLTTKDAAAIRERIPEATYVSGIVRGSTQVIQAEQNWSTSWQGVEADFFTINDWPLALGEGLSEADYRGAGTSVVLGQSVREKLFGDSDPIGASIRVGRVPFTVVGVASSKGQSGWGGDQDDVIFVPLETARRRLMGQLQMPPGTLMQITVGTSRASDLPIVETALNELIRELHRIQPGADDDFMVRNLTQMVSARTETTRLMSLLLGAVASISLIVGGIGIMNIMLVSVTERTREIGIVKALGATPQFILIQFLVEALVLSLFGGLVGLALGWGLALLISVSVPGMTGASVPWWAVALSFGFTTAIGVIFGLAPAIKASRLHPIDALRYE